MDNNEFDYVAAAAEFSDERSVWKGTAENFV